MYELYELWLFSPMAQTCLFCCFRVVSFYLLRPTHLLYHIPPMAPVAPSRATRGGPPLIQLLYRAPLPALYFFAIMMILLTLLATTMTPNADGTDLVVPQTVAEQLDAIKAHAEANAAAIQAGEKPRRPFYPKVFLYHILNGLYHLGLRLELNFTAIQAICGAAWVAHVAESIYAYRMCRKGNASRLTTCVYVLVTFIGGFGQLIPLKQALQRVEEERERRYQ